MKIGIVNDMPMAVEVLRRIVSGMPGHEVAWLAEDGHHAIEKCRENLPDLILMDLIMPGIDGAETTRRIMQETPCAIMVVTASVTDNQSLAFEALSSGAIDVMNTPVSGMHGSVDQNGPLEKKINNIARLIGKHNNNSTQQLSSNIEKNGSDTPLICIGASTGGPAAVVNVLKSLPPSFPAAVIVVVHIDAEFAPGMAEWMNESIALPVSLIHEGDQPKAGHVLLAATNEHLVLSRHKTLHYTPEPIHYHYRPSVDAFMSSLSQHWSGNAVGVLLTGMGSDGAKGLKSMREHGWKTIAQDEASSTIYGMPKAAVKIGAAEKILSLNDIGAELVDIIEKMMSRQTLPQSGGNNDQSR